MKQKSAKGVIIMTDVLFITSSYELKLSHEVNGTMLLATLLRQAGISARILRFAQIASFKKDYSTFVSEITQRILSMEPRCVSFYTIWPFYHIMLRIARELKELRPDLYIVFGGPQASTTAEATMNAASYVDYICVGEGEQTVVPFFRALLNGETNTLAQIPGLYHRVEGYVCGNNSEVPLCDLNTLPYWDEALYMDDYTEPREKMESPNYFMPIDAGRGCPFSCTFCCTSRFWKRTYRLKSVDRLIADIRYYQERFGITSFWFTHDAFTTNKKLVEEFCDRLIAENIHIRWRCTSRVDLITESLVLKMKQAGLVGIEMGVESGSDAMQQRIKKKLNLSNVRNMVKFLLSEKLDVRLFFMYGFPDETEEELAQTVSLQLDLLGQGVKDTSMSFCKFNPATPMTEKYLDQLVLDSNCKIIERGTAFGYEEELSIIQENKAMFPFFYHLNTPVRNEYQYLHYFLNIYREYHRTCQCLRKIYEADELKMYRDFCKANTDVFSQDISCIEKQMVRNAKKMLDKMLTERAEPYTEQLKGILQFEYDMKQLSKEKGDTQLCKQYPFVYAELLMKVSPERLTGGTSELLLSKKDNKTTCRVLSMG